MSTTTTTKPDIGRHVRFVTFHIRQSHVINIVDGMPYLRNLDCRPVNFVGPYINYDNHVIRMMMVTMIIMIMKVIRV